MTPFDPEDLVRHLVELFQLAFTQKMAQIFNVLRFFKPAGDRQFLLLLFNVIPVVISDRNMFSLLLHLPVIGCQLIDDCLFREEFVRWRLDRAFCRQHVANRLLRLD